MKFFGFYVLHLNPLILSCVGAPRLVPPWAADAILFEHPTWYQGYCLKLLKQRTRQKQFARQNIEHHLIFNTPRELMMASRLGVRGAYASQNLFLNETIFRPQTTEKEFDALYVGKLEPFKRHELAAAVKKLAVVKVANVDLARSCPAISHAATNSKALTFQEVANYLNRSHCSLALSKEEGGMLASFESLLCGVPVVSTVSRGGRDIFYDRVNSRIVDSSEGAVATGVAEFVKSPPNSDIIRAKALRDLADHRDQFTRYVASVVSQHDGPAFDFDLFRQTRFENGAADRLFVGDDSAEIPRSIIELLR